jgi:HD-like signal output (HDOD) protein
MNALEYAQQANGSFALPDACFKIKALMADEGSTLEDFANVICVDPSMTSRLLQMFNSAIYNFSGEISTISRVITIIGTQAIYNLMLVDVAATVFKHFSNQSIDLKRFWHLSVFCGLVTKNLAITAGIRDIERLSFAGLLQNFGELIVAKISPTLAKQCEAYNADVLPWQLQQQVVGFSYAEVSAQLLKIWQLPEKIILSIRQYHNAHNIQLNKDVNVLNLASILALVACHPEIFSYDDSIDATLCQALKISTDDLEISANFATIESDNIFNIMNAKFYG